MENEKIEIEENKIIHANPEYEKDIDNPVTNGATKKIIKHIVWIIGALAFVNLLTLGTLEIMTVIEYHDGTHFEITPDIIYALSGSEGVLVGALCLSIEKFFDTRDSVTKAKHKHEEKKIRNERLSIKTKHKQEMRKLKLDHKLQTTKEKLNTFKKP